MLINQWLTFQDIILEYLKIKYEQEEVSFFSWDEWLDSCFLNLKLHCIAYFIFYILYFIIIIIFWLRKGFLFLKH